VDDRKLRARYPDQEFSSAILPKYVRRAPSLDNLVPALFKRPLNPGFSHGVKSCFGRRGEKSVIQHRG